MKTIFFWKAYSMSNQRNNLARPESIYSPSCILQNENFEKYENSTLWKALERQFEKQCYHWPRSSMAAILHFTKWPPQNRFLSTSQPLDNIKPPFRQLNHTSHRPRNPIISELHSYIEL